MDTQEIIIDNEIMDELREISAKKGRNLEETIEKYTCAFGKRNGYISITAEIPDYKEFEEDLGEFVLENIDDETWKYIRKESEQTGESTETIAQRFVDFLNELGAAHVPPPEIMEVRRLSSTFACKKDYKKVV